MDVNLDIETRLGARLVELFKLKPNKEGLFLLGAGHHTKSIKGIGATVISISDTLKEEIQQLKWQQEYDLQQGNSGKVEPHNTTSFKESCEE